MKEDMHIGELVVAKLKEGPRIVRCLAAPTSVGAARNRVRKIRISVGRNKIAEIPAERIILVTGIIASDEVDVEEFRALSDKNRSGIDLVNVWKLVNHDPTRITLDVLAELFWGNSYATTQKVALLLHLEENSLYFTNDGKGYTARSEKYVLDTQARLRREKEKARDFSLLMDNLSQGSLPTRLTPHQSELLEHIREYAVHGENYTKRGTARTLMEGLKPGTKDLQRLSFQLLSKVGIFSPDEHLELERAGIPVKFSKSTITEANDLELSIDFENTHRRNLTSTFAVTIDDSGTEDRDDALSLEMESEPKSLKVVSSAQDIHSEAIFEHPSTTFHLGIHIADAGDLITPEGSLDQEADRRMGTLYLPDRKVAMLPPKISNKEGSLLPNEDRLSLSLLVRITKSGDVIDKEVVPSYIRSHLGLSYDSADHAIIDRQHTKHDMITYLNQIAQSLKKKRHEAGAVSLESPEMIIKVMDSGEVDVRVVQRTAPARQMVTDLMILYNVLMAEFCQRHGIPAVYRSQTVPEIDTITAEAPEGPLRRYLTMRRMPPADLSLIPSPHGGLGVPAYIQVTSPLRRYPDLVMQRQISHFMDVGEPLYPPETIASMSHRADMQLREMARIEEDRKRYWFLKFLDQSLALGGASLFKAIVLENRPGRHSLMELADYPFRFRADVAKTFTPGDSVTLQLHGVDLWRREAHFVHNHQ